MSSCNDLHVCRIRVSSNFDSHCKILIRKQSYQLSQPAALRALCCTSGVTSHRQPRQCRGTRAKNGKGAQSDPNCVSRLLSRSEWKFKEQHAKMWENIAGAKDTLAPVVSTLRVERPRPLQTLHPGISRRHSNYCLHIFFRKIIEIHITTKNIYHRGTARRAVCNNMC